MSEVLVGKVAFVQGGSRGIGAAIVKALAKAGAKVAFTYNASQQHAEQLVKLVQFEGGQAVAIQADSAQPTAIEQAILQTVAAYGNLDILVNNVGTAVFGNFAEISLADFEQTYQINIRSVFIASQVASQHMNNNGRIIHIGSTNADRMPVAGGAVYAMSKSALVGLTKGMARDLGGRGITVNTVQPGPVNTDMNPENGAHAAAAIPMIALERYAQPNEIADFVTYLASPAAAFITGACLTIDGGFAA